MKLFTQNAKMAKSGGSTMSIWNFGITALHSPAAGLKTCPMAGTCAKGCYAQQGAYRWGNVAPVFEARTLATQAPGFVQAVANELEVLQRRAGRKKQLLVVRIHDSGDFYSQEYLNKWIRVIRAHPAVTFYAYTKMVHFFKGQRLPPNFTVIYSEGGKLDHLITHATDRHSRVFGSAEELQAAGYADASADDSVAFGANPRVGLIYHGAKSKAWRTA
jgi:hypothetical protein